MKRGEKCHTQETLCRDSIYGFFVDESGRWHTGEKGDSRIIPRSVYTTSRWIMSYPVRVKNGEEKLGRGDTLGPHWVKGLKLPLLV